MNTPEFYQESNDINPKSFIISLFTLIAICLSLGYMYSIISFYMPMPYVNSLITLAFGAALLFSNRVLARFTHNRSKKSKFLLAILSGILANYFQWTAYLIIAVTGKLPAPMEYFSQLPWLFQPQTFFGIIGEIYSIGLWSIGSIEINGIILGIIWAIEFIMIMAIPVLGALKSNPFPYSEFNRQWYPKYTLTNDFQSSASVSILLKKVTDDILDTLNNLGSGGAARHMKVHVYYHKDEVNQYITFENILIDRENKKSKEPVIENLTINNKTAEAILNDFPNHHEKDEVL